ncbi:hypothetical protein [Streptomyces sp. NPDC053427]|uniref:hypothetical protein n=1 Tax=Streptomyces sp. NPDC053427 TaxID=3365701 RepID=UPI0037D55CEC
MPRETRIESDGVRRIVPLGPCPWLPGWEMVYDHAAARDPHAMIRKGEGAATVYAITCPHHATHTVVPTLNAERDVRRQGRGAWCADCATT